MEPGAISLARHDTHTAIGVRMPACLSTNIHAFCTVIRPNTQQHPNTGRSQMANPIINHRFAPHRKTRNTPTRLETTVTYIYGVTP